MKTLYPPIRMLAFLALALFSTVSLAETPRFFTELSDIPLMPGLYELTDKTTVFDKPEGRIVESSAVSETENASKIRAFYNSALPQLGWVRQGEDTYIRGEEVLRLGTDSGPVLTVLKITVFPR